MLNDDAVCLRSDRRCRPITASTAIDPIIAEILSVGKRIRSLRGRYARRADSSLMPTLRTDTRGHGSRAPARRSVAPSRPYEPQPSANLSPFLSPSPRKRRCRAKAPRNHNPRVGGSSPSSGIRTRLPNPAVACWIRWIATMTSSEPRLRPAVGRCCTFGTLSAPGCYDCGARST